MCNGNTLLLNQPLILLWTPFYTVANTLTRELPNTLTQESSMNQHHNHLMKHLALHLHAKLGRIH